MGTHDFRWMGDGVQTMGPDYYVRRCNELSARIAALESQLAQYRWRRVEEELPKTWESVLVPKGDISDEAFVDSDGEWWWSHTPDSRCGTVRNWMPLPAAPEEEE